MSLVGIIIGIAILFFVGKAILSTIWGLCLVFQGACCLTAAAILKFIVVLLDAYDSLRKTAKW